MDFYGAGKILKDRRIELGLSQKEVARRAGCRLNSISEIEQGSIPNTEVLQKICPVLDVSPDYVLRNYDKQFLLYAVADYAGRVSGRESEDTLLKALELIGDAGNDQ